MNENKLTRMFFAALMIAAVAALPGCATKKPGESIKTANVSSADEDVDTSDNRDPLEGLNRGLFKVHEVIDGVLLKPVAHIYRGVMPDVAQISVKNVLTNLSSPVVLLNSVLQWDVVNAERTVGRFVINSTVGVAGIFDVATGWGIPKQHNKDFGQTMGVYGVGTGPYLVIPIIGPSDTRDILGFVADIFSDPFTYILTRNEAIALDVTKGLVKRVDYLPLTDRIEQDSLDPYTTYRSIYLQNRAKVVRDYKDSDTGLEKEAGK
jgi:phospholipid-binding lipoprotein MlaA